MTDDKTAKLEALRKEVRAWLLANLPKGWGTPEYKAPGGFTQERHDLAKWWTKKCYDAGYTGFGYPKEYGGIERPREEIMVIREEMLRTGTPGYPSSLGLLLAAPTLMAHGQEWQKKRFIPKILSGEESWCEGFSEPNAGSDLANVQTYGVRDGKEWVIKGQKCWTSMWKFADYGILVVKTDLKAPRHRNLTVFIFDVKIKGFERRPLRQMTDESEFGEMFFDDMRIPQENMMGEEGRGWYVAMTTLAAERSMGGEQAVGGQQAEVRLGSGADNLIELARSRKRFGKSLWEDPVYRQRIAQAAIEEDAYRIWGPAFRAKARKAGASLAATLSFEASTSKNYWAETRQRRAMLIEDILGAYSQLMRGSRHAIDEGDWVFEVLRSRGASIEMGTTEVNRNIIAERILGLPREDAVKKA